MSPAKFSSGARSALPPFTSTAPELIEERDAERIRLEQARTAASELEDLAIQLSFDADRDQFTGRLKTLTQHRARAFELMRLALTEPRFDAEPVERIRNQVQASLRRLGEDPDYVASLTWFETAFPGHPYGTQPTIGITEHLKLPAYGDMVEYFDRWYRPNNMAILLAGDIDAATALPVLEKYFGAAAPAPAGRGAGAGTVPVMTSRSRQL
mgnify:CR=1 FL=1